MKYLIVMLLSFNAYADIKVIVTLDDGRITCGDGCKFKTQMEADLWKSDNISNDSWGKPDRWIKKEIGDTCPDAERTVDDGFGNFYNECFYSVEYTITETDITAEVQAAEDKKDADDLRIEAIKIKDKAMKLEELIEILQLKGTI